MNLFLIIQWIFKFTKYLYLITIFLDIKLKNSKVNNKFEYLNLNTLIIKVKRI